MSQFALYRKYRSRDFSEVIGQDHIVKTLTSALAAGRISHAYLFAGPRGVGKTSLARLLARSVNCSGNLAAAGKPCNQCANCQAAINAHLDLIEIDAASNRSIDEVRQLRDKISLAPAQGKYKVYIIDEVHMLTKEAFNALLKTLEEPPAHAIFILATTEAHKLPETIISRTQRFNFKPITNTDLEKRLAVIAKQEKIQIDDEALAMVAASAGGGFRDAISMLDQLAGGGGPVTAATVRAILGLADQQAVEQLSQAWAESKTIRALGIIDQLAGQGIQIAQLVNQLLQFWRGVMLIKAGAPVKASAAQHQVANQVPLDWTVAVIGRLSAVAKSAHQQLMLEAAIAGLSQQVPPPSPKKPLLPSAPSPQPSPQQDAPAPHATDQWTKALIVIKQHNNSLYALLRSCQVRVSPDEINIGCQFNFHRDRLNEAKNRQIIDQAVRQAMGKSLPVKIEVTSQPAPAQPNDPVVELVGTALEILGGEVVDE